MKNLLEKVIEEVHTSVDTFFKFISANDSGKTGSHQAGFYIPKNAISIAFEHPGKKGENKEKFIKIEWQNGLTTNSRFIYYGKINSK
jgi:hypothetical protein